MGLKKLIIFIAKKIYVLFVIRITDDIKINQGIILGQLNKVAMLDLANSKYKIFSQWGEDGMLQFLTSNLHIQNKTFIEFGVENFLESNCRFLMMKDNWSGFVIDGSPKNIAELKSTYFYWKYDLKAEAFFLTKSCINEVLERSGFDNNVGILSIDLDGNDYYILEEIRDIKASILICEFNPIFGMSRKITVPYSDSFKRFEAHYSGLYWGASISAINSIAQKKGYALVGVSDGFNNAFFVKKELLNSLVKEISLSEITMTSKYRDSRDKNHNLSFLDQGEQLQLLKGLPVYNIETGLKEPF